MQLDLIERAVGGGGGRGSYLGTIHMEASIQHF